MTLHREPGILAIEGISLGHAGYFAPERLTGLTVLLPPPGATVGVDVRGGGPATHETDVIAPGTHSYGADALVLTGGSALGLHSVAGVSHELARAGRGFPAPGIPGSVIPLVPAAAIYDLGRGIGTDSPADHDRGPGAVLPPQFDDGAMATSRALSGTETAVRGSLGVGSGARSGMQSLRSSLGSFAIQLPNGVTVAALVAANPLGTIGTPDGELWAHPILRSFGLDLPPIPGLPMPQVPGATSAKNTTIAIVATDAKLDSAQVTRMASGAHAGISRAVRPSHTLFDGDSVFSLATGHIPLSEETATAELVEITSAAADALSLAIIDAHVSAAPVEAGWGQPPTLTELAPDFTEAFRELS